jgi:hypothetical protein
MFRFRGILSSVAKFGEDFMNCGALSLIDLTVCMFPVPQIPLPRDDETPATTAVRETRLP